ncbi:MAG: dephospho-CoA kinase [Pseudomonadota bacterium]
MKTIGLTGGVACGKSTVAECFAEKGIPVIDSDAIARALLDGSPLIQAQIHTAFGTVERKALRRIIFGDISKRAQLERILHPPILGEIRRRVEEFRKKSSPPKGVILVIPLLYETEGESWVDEVIAVVSRRENQVARLKSRDGATDKLAAQMIDAQMPNDEKASRAHHVIQNNGTLDQLQNTVDTLISKLF